MGQRLLLCLWTCCSRSGEYGHQSDDAGDEENDNESCDESGDECDNDSDYKNGAEIANDSVSCYIWGQLDRLGLGS